MTIAENDKSINNDSIILRILAYLIKSSTPTFSALASLVNVSIVGFVLVPFSTLTTVFKDKSPSLATFSKEYPFFFSNLL